LATFNIKKKSDSLYAFTPLYDKDFMALLW
jgi:hypothetical protein